MQLHSRLTPDQTPSPPLPGAGCSPAVSPVCVQSLYILYIPLHIHVTISCILACTTPRAYLHVHLCACTSVCAPHLACTSTHAPYLACTSTRAPHLVNLTSYTSRAYLCVHLCACTSSRMHLSCTIFTRAPINIVHPSSPSAIKIDLDYSVSHCYILAISPLYFSFINSFWSSALSHNHC